MFHFARFSSHTYVFSMRYPLKRLRAERVGFPIRTSPGQSLFGSSPRHFGPYAVLLRLLVSRHSPCALVEIAHNENTQECFHCSLHHATPLQEMNVTRPVPFWYKVQLIALPTLFDFDCYCELSKYAASAEYNPDQRMHPDSRIPTVASVYLD